MSRNRLYTLLAFACFAGYAWLSLLAHQHEEVATVCLFKNITGYACPSCGVTRALFMIMGGDIGASLYINPLGLIVALIMLLSPLWIIYDLLFRRSTLLGAYLRAEIFLRQKQVALPAVVIILANWAWNIYKGV